MMKLRLGDKFGTAAGKHLLEHGSTEFVYTSNTGPGTSWRLLFTFALFPWLRKYRVRSEVFDQKEFKFSHDGAKFQNFVRSKAGGHHVRRSLPTIKEAESDLDSKEAEIIAALRKEIDTLKTENERLKISMREKGDSDERPADDDFVGVLGRTHDNPD